MTDRPAGIIFDLDGTLLDTLASLAKAFNMALADLNCPPHPVDAYRRIIGDGARVAAMRALPEKRQSSRDIELCVGHFQRHYAENWQTATVYGGISELLSELKPDYPLAVLSNKDESFTRQCCDHFFPGLFTLAIGFSDRVIHKPDPSGAMRIAAHLDTDVRDLWVIGDTATDMKTAVNTGMTGVGVLWGFRDRNELAISGATHIIENPSELTGLLGGIE